MPLSQKLGKLNAYHPRKAKNALALSELLSVCLDDEKGCLKNTRCKGSHQTDRLHSLTEPVDDLAKKVAQYVTQTW